MATLKEPEECTRLANPKYWQEIRFSPKERIENHKEQVIFTFKEESEENVLNVSLFSMQRGSKWAWSVYLCVLLCECLHVDRAVFLSLRTPAVMRGGAGRSLGRTGNSKAKILPLAKRCFDINLVDKSKRKIYASTCTKTTVTVVMLRNIYTAAKQALESHHYNIQIQWYCWWVGNQKSHWTACQSLSFLSIQCCGRHRRNVFGLQPVQRSPVQKYKCETLEDIFAYEHFTVSLHRSFLVYRSWFSHFSWIRLNIQRILTFFLSLNCCDEKGHWDIVREERRTKATEQRRAQRTPVQRLCGTLHRFHWGYAF